MRKILHPWTGFAQCYAITALDNQRDGAGTRVDVGGEETSNLDVETKGRHTNKSRDFCSNDSKFRKKTDPAEYSTSSRY